MTEIREINYLAESVYNFMAHGNVNYTEIDSDVLGFLCGCGSELKIRAYRKDGEMIWNSECEECKMVYQEIYKPWRGYSCEELDFGKRYSFCEEHKIHFQIVPKEELQKIILQIDSGGVELRFSDAEKMKTLFETSLSPIKGHTLYYILSRAEMFGGNFKDVNEMYISITPYQRASYGILFLDKDVERLMIIDNY